MAEIDEFLVSQERQLTRHEMGVAMQGHKYGLFSCAAEWENAALALPVYPTATNLQNADGSFTFLADYDPADSAPVE